MSGPRDVASALAAGLHAGRHSKVAVLWSWLCVLLLSLPFASGVAALVFAASGMTPREPTPSDGTGLRGVWGPGIAGLSAELIVVLARTPGGPLLLAAWVGTALLLWAVLSTYFTGATIAAVRRVEPTSMHELFTGAGRVFGRLLRLLAFGLPFWIAVVGLGAFAVRALVLAVTAGWLAEGWVLAARLVGVSCVLGVAGWASGAYDLMRIEAVSRGEHRARWAFVRGLSRAVRSPASTLAVALPFQLGSLGLTLLALGVDVRIPRDSFLTIAFAFILEQGVALGRAWLRVATLGAEVAWVKRADGAARRATGGRGRDEAREREDARGREEARGAEFVIGEVVRERVK